MCHTGRMTRKNNKYEIVVERKVRETHTVAAPTRTEAAIEFARGTTSIDEVSTETVDERVLTPRLVEEGYDPDQGVLDTDSVSKD